MTVEVDVPDGRSGEWAVETFEVSETEAKFESLRAMINHTGRELSPGTYKRLTRNRCVVMSNTPAEVRDHRDFIFEAKRCENVLINGLGLGVALKEVLKSSVLKKVIVVEKSEDVIRLVGPAYTTDPRVTLVHADAFEYTPPKGMKFGAVWHDVWDNICSENLPEMKRLHRKYARRTRWQESWCRELCEDSR
jgi:hypothetical protein